LDRQDFDIGRKSWNLSTYGLNVSTASTAFFNVSIISHNFDIFLKRVDCVDEIAAYVDYLS